MAQLNLCYRGYIFIRSLYIVMFQKDVIFVYFEIYKSYKGILSLEKYSLFLVQKYLLTLYLLSRSSVLTFTIYIFYWVSHFWLQVLKYEQSCIFTLADSMIEVYKVKRIKYCNNRIMLLLKLTKAKPCSLKLKIGNL